MTLLDNHLEQISLSLAAIAELPFPPPKIFTNAILHSHDITALIRDTESHERALFKLAEAEENTRSFRARIARRSTVHGLNGSSEGYKNAGGFSRSQGQRSAVAVLLGGDLEDQIKRQGLKDNVEKSDVDVDILLNGAQKLGGIYPIAGAPEKISSLRVRHEQLSSSIAHYEAREAKQMSQLAKMKDQRNAGAGQDDLDEVYEEEDDEEDEIPQEVVEVTEEDLRKEEDEIRMLEEKKRALEERVSGMERDLGGLLR